MSASGIASRAIAAGRLIATAVRSGLLAASLTACALIALGACAWHVRAPARPDATMDSDGAAGDVDDGASGEVRDANQPPPVNWRLRRIPRLAGGTAIGGGVCTGDVDGDGRRELVMLGVNGPTSVVDAAGLETASFTLPTAWQRHCVVRDLDLDGAPELAVATGTNSVPGPLYIGAVRDGAWRERWRSDPTYYVWRDRQQLAVGGRGAGVVPAIVVASQPPTSRIDAWTLPASAAATALPGVAAPPARADAVAALDVTGDPTPEIVVGYACPHGGLQVLSPAGEVLADAPGLDSPSAIVPLGTGGEREFAVLTGQWCNDATPPALRALRVSGTRMEELARLELAPPGDSYRGALGVGDVIDDARPEVVACFISVTRNTQGFECVVVSQTDAGTFIERSRLRWSDGFLSGLSIDDLDGDGAVEFYVGSTTAVHVVRRP